MCYIVLQFVRQNCSDGVQFSGLFCAADFIFERIKEEQQIDVFLAVQKIRANRPQFIINYVSMQQCCYFDILNYHFFLIQSIHVNRIQPKRPNLPQWSNRIESKYQEQYLYLHQVALAYLQSFEQYANFK